MQQVVCVRRKKKEETKKNPPHPEHTPKFTCSPESATSSKRSATKHVPRVSQYFHDSIYLGFVEIGLVQLSQSLKRTIVTTH